MGRAGHITPSLFSLFLENKRMDCTKEKLQVTLKKKKQQTTTFLLFLQAPQSSRFPHERLPGTLELPLYNANSYVR